MKENRLNRSLTIMLIDDSEVDLFIHSQLISYCFPDFNIIEFRNANDALNYLNESADEDKNFHIIPDVILLDIVMPLKDGFDFLKEYKRIPFPGKRLPELMALTCSINPQDQVRCEQNSDVSKFLLKPLSKKTTIELFS